MLSRNGPEPDIITIDPANNELSLLEKAVLIMLFKQHADRNVFERYSHDHPRNAYVVDVIVPKTRENKKIEVRLANKILCKNSQSQEGVPLEPKMVYEVMSNHCQLHVDFHQNEIEFQTYTEMKETKKRITNVQNDSNIAGYEEDNLLYKEHAKAKEKKKKYLIINEENSQHLKKLLMDNPHLPIEMRIKIIAAVLYAVQTQVHDYDMVHLDLRPENLIIHIQNGEPVVKVINYALCCRENEICVNSGTLNYISPEMMKDVSNTLSANKKMDLYALGIIIATIINPQIKLNTKRMDILERTYHAPDLSQLALFPQGENDVPLKLQSDLTHLVANMTQEESKLRVDMHTAIHCIEKLQEEMGITNEDVLKPAHYRHIYVFYNESQGLVLQNSPEKQAANDAHLFDITTTETFYPGFMQAYQTFQASNKNTDAYIHYYHTVSRLGVLQNVDVVLVKDKNSINSTG